MIHDSIRNFGLYGCGENWKKLRDFLSGLGPDTPDGKYPLTGDDIHVSVFTYGVKTYTTAILEAHQKYIDIHLTLTSPEKIIFYNTADLRVQKAYDLSKDAEFYEKPAVPGQTLVLMPGYFVILPPGDAHMTQLAADKCGEKQVKKAVVKYNSVLDSKKFRQ